MFKGTGTALITPFDNLNNVDYDSLARIVRFQIDNGIDALIVLGTTGESPVVSTDEREKIINIVVEEAQKRIPVIVGTGTNNTESVIQLNKITESAKADGLLIVNPYYNKGTQESLMQHYKYISENTKLPIILYNVPSRTGMNVIPETVLKIHRKCSNVVAVKEASGDISQIARLIALKPDSLKVYSGNDDQTLAIMALGGSGVISVFSNPYPKEMKNLTDSLLSNDLDAARKYNNLYMSMMQKLFIETSPAPVKYVMSKSGLCENILRLPLIEASKEAEQILDEEIKKLQKVI